MWNTRRLDEMLALKEQECPIKSSTILAISLVIFTALYYDV